MRLVYMGSPACAIHPLAWVLDHKPQHFEIVGVISQEAKPVGRSKKLVDPPLATFAKEKGLTVLQPQRASSKAGLEELRQLAPDVVITCAYGQILSQKFLEIPTRATINIHPSRLPQYRGAIPVHAAILDGCLTTAVSLLFTVKELDAGNLILQKDFDLFPHENAEDALNRLFQESGPILLESLEKLKNPNFVGVSQDPSLATFCKKIEKTDGNINWQELSAQEVYRKFLAYTPWPGLHTFLGDKRLVLIKVELESCTKRLEGGELHFAQRNLFVGCASGQLKISTLVPEGGKVMAAESFWNGLKNRSGILKLKMTPEILNTNKQEHCHAPTR